MIVKKILNFENIMITLLKKYMKSYYEYKKSEWESQYLEYRDIDEKKDKANLIDESSKYKDSEIYLLRNQSRTGLGFFAEGNFYPDFIMWLIKDNKQYITFLDPKGIRNCNPEDGPKLNFGIKIKEIEERLKGSSTILNSFILSNTQLSEINIIQGNDYTYDFFEKKNVLFQEEHNETYISKMFEKIV